MEKITRIQSLTNLLYDEIYRDRVYSLHILDCHNRVTITAQNIHVKKYDNIVQSYAPAIFERITYTNFLSHCNDIFESYINKCYTDFVIVGQPIITRRIATMKRFIRCLDLIKKRERKAISF